MNIYRILLLSLLFVSFSFAQKGVDEEGMDVAMEENSKSGGRNNPAAPIIAKMAIRARVTKAVPEQEFITIAWTRGFKTTGDGTKGAFTSEDKKPQIAVGAWSAPLPLGEVVGLSPKWQYPTITIRSPQSGGKKLKSGIEQVVVEFEVTHDGKVIKTFSEISPQGSVVSFAFPGNVLVEKGPNSPEFADKFQGLAGHARDRREYMEKLFSESDPLPKLVAIGGNLGGGYGEGAGYKIRHTNLEIVKDEARTMQLMGYNSLTSYTKSTLIGMAEQFNRMYFGGPGSGNPMTILHKGIDKEDKEAKQDASCPFHPAIKEQMATAITNNIEDHRAAGAQQSWGIWDDEIGVYVKEHMLDCPRCQDAFRNYLRTHNIEPAMLGKQSWDQVLPYAIWPAKTPKPTEPKGAKSQSADAREPKRSHVAPPEDAGDALRYYYTFRFMTHATAQVYPEAVQEFKAAGIPIYALQGSTPAATGHSLDWHEFYDMGANSAILWETSNSNPLEWQWESYLADIARGISMRHSIPIGCTIKPGRGAPQQRMLSVISRGTEAIEWYHYGPDYTYNGDSFSQHRDLLEAVAKAGRVLGRAEEHLYHARWAGQPEVAFVSPRSSEIWGKANNETTAFEDAKWVYSALTHAHIPVDILSEQQLAEGKLDQYKVIYIVGPHLRSDSAAKVAEWVKAGGSLWTDAIGLSRDEANQPLTVFQEVLGLGERKLEKWGSVSGLKPIMETNAPDYANFVWNQNKLRAVMGREALSTKDGQVLATFSDGKPAVIQRRFGDGQVTVAGFLAGLTYSAKVRREDYNMRADFDSAIRSLIAAPAVARKVYQPVLPSEPLVEAVLLEKDGKRSITLMNWAYQYNSEGSKTRNRLNRSLQVAENLRVALPGVENVKSVRSVAHGELKVEGSGANRSVVLPNLQEIDVLILE